MKKTLALLLTSLLVATSFAGCNRGNNNNSNTNSGGASSSAPEASIEEPDDGSIPETEEEGLRTGMGVITSTGGSTPAAEALGMAQVDTTIAAVVLDDDGRVLRCDFDSVNTGIAFTLEGILDTAVDTMFPTRRERTRLQDSVADVDLTWFNHAETLADYVVGMNIDEIRAIALDDDNLPVGEELLDAFTLPMHEFKAALEKAMSNARVRGAEEPDHLGIGAVTHMENSKNAEDDENHGLAQAYSTYAVVTISEAGVITSCIIDGSQTEVSFNNQGQVVSDLDGEYKTKNELAEDYGMKEASSIGKEWYEQAQAFAEYVTGKTMEELEGISVEEGADAIEDLHGSVTISIGNLLEAVKKAVDNVERR